MPISALDPRTALVVVDLQQGTTTRPAAPYPVADVVARTGELAAAFRARGLPVVLVRMTVARDGADATPGRTDLSGRGGGLPPEGWDVLLDELTGHPEDLVVTKRTWGSFHGTDLDLQLRRRGVTQVVLTGIATSIGVESTARAAHEHGYTVSVVVDAVTDLSAENHEHATTRIFPMLAETGTTADVLALVKSG